MRDCVRRGRFLYTPLELTAALHPVELLKSGAPGQVIKISVFLFQSAVVVLAGAGEGNRIHGQNSHGAATLFQTLVALVKELLAYASVHQSAAGPHSQV